MVIDDKVRSTTKAIERDILKKNISSRPIDRFTISQIMNFYNALCGSTYVVERNFCINLAVKNLVKRGEIFQLKELQNDHAVYQISNIKSLWIDWKGYLLE